jgi:hypothetical protein
MKQAMSFSEGGKMFKKILFLALIITCSFCVVGLSFAESKAETSTVKDQPQPQAPQSQAPQAPKAQETKPREQVSEEVIQGTVKEIAEDKSYIVIDEVKVITTKEFLEDSYIEVGDKLEVTAEKTSDGLKAKNYNYIFEEETIPSGADEGKTSDEMLPGEY